MVGLVATTLIGMALLNYFFPFIAWMRAVWGLIGVLLFFVGLLGGLIALVVYLLHGKRATPYAEMGATIDQLDTRQS